MLKTGKARLALVPLLTRSRIVVVFGPSRSRSLGRALEHARAAGARPSRALPGRFEALLDPQQALSGPVHPQRWGYLRDRGPVRADRRLPETEAVFACSSRVSSHAVRYRFGSA